MPQSPYLPGTVDTPGIPIGSITSGICQIAPHTWTLVNQYQQPPSAENHQGIHVLDDMGLVWDNEVGPTRLSGGYPAIEINHLNSDLGAAVPITFGIWVAGGVEDGAWTFRRSRSTTVGGSVTVLAGDELGRLEFRGDMGGGPATANAAARILARVPTGWVNPGTGTPALRLAGEVAFQTAPGDGIDEPLDRLVVKSNGDFNVVSGTLYVAAVITAIAKGGGIQIKPNFRNFRSLIADDSVVAVPIPASSTAIVAFLSEDTAGVAAPVGQIAVNTATSIAPELIASIGTANITVGTGVPTGTTGTDNMLNIRNNGDGNLYLENRLGGSRTYSAHIING